MTTLIELIRPIGETSSRWEQVIFSTAAFMIWFAVCHVVMMLSRLYRRSSLKTQSSILARVAGPAHAIIVGLPAAGVVFQQILAPSWSEDWPEAPRHALQTLCTFSMGYMIVDSIVLLPRWDLAMVAHHLLTLSAEYGCAFQFYKPAHIYEPLLTALLLTTELTTPFLHMSYLLNKYGHATTPSGDRSWAAFINLSLLTLTWIIVRLVPFAWYFYVLPVHQWHHMQHMNGFERVHMFVLVVGLAVLNVTWFVKLVKLFDHRQVKAVTKEE
eukprot:TRINITY_DN17247_c0_g1_i1.p1 TRINITY_DN17247_c0_g1~~TRINITY_DN17247_c0_g1_i1.p1  ORF type:complete len:270 (+),score=31.36 TRINITY_DN17247_c0_g1_i1:2-811(+)